MIIKASQRAHGGELAAHLLNAQDNEHIEVHEMRGFISDDLAEAFQEIQAVSRATKCQQYLFSLSLNPPPDADVSVTTFEEAADRIEGRLGLTGQPRALILHEKEGRLHAHCVWSRIQGDDMRAVHLPFYKTRLMEIARELYLEHGWTVPRGLEGFAPDPLNYERPEYQQARRAEKDPKALKTMFHGCWSQSDGAAGFRAALLDHGFALARGDRRGFVAVDDGGEVYSLSRWCGVKSKDLSKRLGEPQNYPNVDDAREALAAHLAAQETQQASIQELHLEKRLDALSKAKNQMIASHQTARKDLANTQRQRQRQEAAIRAARFDKGLKGIWQWVTGNRSKIRKQNELEVRQCDKRDLKERERLAQTQRKERRRLNRQIAEYRKNLELARSKAGPELEGHRNRNQNRDDPSYH